MSIDEILAGVDTVMTPELIRLFKVAGCSPPACHACAKQIRSGHTFKLLPHKGTDEMLCAKCGEPELVKRDRRLERQNQESAYISNHRGSWSGFSRPSKEQP